MEFVLQGATATASDFEHMGVVNKTFPADQVLDEALSVAAKIASLSSPVLKLAKRAVTNGRQTFMYLVHNSDFKIAYENSLANGLDKEKDFYYASFSLEDREEGMRAFLEKRSPEFKHK